MKTSTAIPNWVQSRTTSGAGGSPWKAARPISREPIQPTEIRPPTRANRSPEGERTFRS